MSRRSGLQLVQVSSLALLLASCPVEGADTETGSRFLFVPYPITEPAIGSGVLAGPVWMRPGPPEPSGPAKPQAFGAGVLWTDGGSRGAFAFDHRAWGPGRWRTTAIAGEIDLRVLSAWTSPTAGEPQDFELALKGGSVSAERRLGKGPDRARFRVFAADATLAIDQVGLGGERTRAAVNGIALSWSRDTRDEAYAPSSGLALDATLTAYPPLLGASFDAQSLELTGRHYWPVGRGAFGARGRVQAGFGDPPFYLRPFVSFRGIAALRYAGKAVGSAEAEYRRPLAAQWDAVGFGGIGVAHGGFDGRARTTVSAVGVGVRYRMPRYFGLTFGLDVARGPDGIVTNLQIGDAWSR